MNRNKVTTKEKGESGCKSPLDGSPQVAHQHIGEYGCQKKMKNNSPVKSQVERQEKVRETEWVEHPRLDGGKERHTTFYVWIPEREMTLTDSFNPEEAKGIKKSGKISFHQQDLAGENVVEVKQGENEKAQNHQNFLYCWISERHY